ncbi:osteopetrosis-associated transmembrane protein 1 isoform X3 [Brienomyrus brachyistius]|uniref:osteopetrosis-associated transmembrane protein 1 isoform X3 n=1 Tax=Brienomyrus brachyistius TaxID=42636 RepID=UPI0020B27094|nr:osteopetrosis-associated transmembrane protein 1 isoform X3 [Brienomyrus brachyistius]
MSFCLFFFSLFFHRPFSFSLSRSAACHVMTRGKQEVPRELQLAVSPRSDMELLLKVVACFVALLHCSRAQASSFEVNLTVLPSAFTWNGVANRLSALPSILTVSPSQEPSFHSSSELLLSSFHGDPEISDYCRELLHLFGQRYVSYVACLVSSARPVKVCLNCFMLYDGLTEIYSNISQVGPGNESCQVTLLRSDRLMLLYELYEKITEIWTTSHCSNCLFNDSLSSDTLHYMTKLNESLRCFESQKSNHSELCKECKTSYKLLNDLYGRMEKNKSLCIDIEDAMNMTRILWSKSFNCSIPREETVPVIAVSSFMLFLPIIFYLSSFLHSEQKKRKLIHPKRVKSSNSLMNIQDKHS